MPWYQPPGSPINFETREFKGKVRAAAYVGKEFKK